MVTQAAYCATDLSARLILAASEGSQTLPPPTKAAAQMALIGIALVGLLFVVMILLGGHWARRQGTHRRGPVVPPDRVPIVPRKNRDGGSHEVSERDAEEPNGAP